MHVTEKLIRPLTEAKYLNADNVDRYRSIMRIFFENYEKLKYWLYQEEVYAEMQRAIDAGYDNPDPKVQAEWRKVKIKGNRPTPEEVINYAVSTLTAEQR